MDNARLITIVEDYKELYNLRHPLYTNQQRRDNIWEEIGRQMNEKGIACKERWTRIRENHRKALILRKTKTGQAASKLKPPKYAPQLTFLSPYLKDEETGRSNLSPVNVNSDMNEAQHESESSDTQASTSSVTSPRSVGRKWKYSQSPSTAVVLQEYLSKKETATNVDQSNTMIEFFINMAKTVNTFPIQDQVIIKSQLFQMVNQVEMRLAFPSSPSVSNVTLPPPPSPTSNAIFPLPSSSKTTRDLSTPRQKSNLENTVFSHTQDLDIKYLSQD